jgi:hypothetical protein
MGVPKFSEELFETICNKIGKSSDGLQKICESEGVSAVAFYSWVKEDKELLNRYAHARELQAEYLADQILDIADDKTGDLVDSEFGQQGNAANVARSKLQVEARKWIAAKLKPKKYGDKVEIEQNLNVNKLPDWLTGSIVEHDAKK